MIELERTFLVKRLPEGLERCPKREVIDSYYPKDAKHPVLRLRKDGDRYLLTKKHPVGEDKSVQEEQTAELTREEFEALSRLGGKHLEKVRYEFDYKGRKVEIDVFKGALEGLVLADFEFSNREERDAFEMPEFCLVEVTHEEFLAGGMLCGKKYTDISKKLEKFGFSKIINV
jgi:adenylate cyclase